MIDSIHKSEKIQFPDTVQTTKISHSHIGSHWYGRAQTGIENLSGRPASLPRGPAGKLWSHEGM